MGLVSSLVSHPSIDSFMHLKLHLEAVEEQKRDAIQLNAFPLGQSKKQKNGETNNNKINNFYTIFLVLRK